MVKQFFKQFIVSFKPSKMRLAAFVFGAVGVFAFDPVGIAPLALVSMTGLFWLWFHAKTRLEGFRLGLWFGLGLFGVGVSWLISSMYFYSGMNLVLSLLATFIFVLFLSLYIGATGFLALNFKNNAQPGFVLVVLFPTIWVFMEWLRATLFGGFPFMLMGTSHIHTWLDGYAPIFGVLGVSWAIALTAGLLLLIGIQKAWIGGSGLLAAIWLMGAGLQNVKWVTPVGEPVKIGLTQGNISQDKKWQPREFVPSMETYVQLTKKALKADAKVVLWPETAIPTYYDLAKKGLLHNFINDTRLLGTNILVGVITRNASHDKYYNAVVNLKDDQHPYLKHHLVPFSEYFPFSSLLDKLSQLFNIPFSSFTAGKADQPLMRLGPNLVDISICYEMSFGEELAKNLPQARYLLTVSNDGWFAHTFEPAQQLQEVEMRALELGREIGRSTNTGYTAIIDIKGNIKQSIPPYKQGVLIGDIQPYQGQTFFAKWKQLPILFLLSLLLSFIVARQFIIKTNK